MALKAKSDHIAELADLLGVGLVRLHAKKSSQFGFSRAESSLDFSPDQSGHASGIAAEKSDD